MEGVLGAMAGVKLYELPKSSAWTLDMFVHTTYVTCCQAAHVSIHII